MQQWFTLNTDISILNTHNKAAFFLSFFIYVIYTCWKKNRSCRPEVFLGKGVLKICSKCTGEHLCRSAISVKLLCNFTEIELSHDCSPVNLSHIFRTPFLKNTSGRLLQKISIHLQMVSEAAVCRCSINPVFSKIPKNLHKNTCLGVSFSIKLQARPPQNTSRRLFQMVYWTQCT